MVHHSCFSHNLSATSILQTIDVDFHEEDYLSISIVSIGVLSVLEVEIPIFEMRKPMQGGTLRHCSFSICSPNLTSNFDGINTSIKKAKCKIASKILNFAHFPVHFNDLICTKNEIKLQNKNTLSCTTKNSFKNHKKISPMHFITACIFKLEKNTY